MDKLQAHTWNQETQQSWLLWGYGAMVVLCIFAAVATGFYALVGLPMLLLLGYLSLVDFEKVFYLLLFSIPLSTEVYLPGGLGTDLPTEPLMILLMLIGGVYLLRHGRALNAAFLRHPITLLLLLHLAWIYITTVSSDLLLVSVKFSLAKTWYIAAFFFLGGFILRSEKQYRRFFWLIFWPLLFTVLYSVLRHAGYGFSFADVHKVLAPFQRNHVNYAADMAIFLCFMWYALYWLRRGSWQWYAMLGACGFLLVAIYFSYTRAAYVSLFAAAAAYFIFRFRLIRVALAAAMIAAIVGLAYVAEQNRYLDYAPNYDRTISHKNFDNLIEATYNMEDISTMERLYRWVAGLHMSTAQPWMGFGPGNFVNFYESYTVKSFRTYVSDNEERSGIHSYYLLTLVEQGLIGLLLFLVFNFYLLIRGERIYHETRDLHRRTIVMSCLLALVVINAFQIINDLIETDKVGSFYFLSAAILVNMDLLNKRERTDQS